MPIVQSQYLWLWLQQQGALRRNIGTYHPHVYWIGAGGYSPLTVVQQPWVIQQWPVVINQPRIIPATPSRKAVLVVDSKNPEMACDPVTDQQYAYEEGSQSYVKVEDGICVRF